MIWCLFQYMVSLVYSRVFPVTNSTGRSLQLRGVSHIEFRFGFHLVRQRWRKVEIMNICLLPLFSDVSEGEEEKTSSIQRELMIFFAGPISLWLNRNAILTIEQIRWFMSAPVNNMHSDFALCCWENGYLQLCANLNTYCGKAMKTHSQKMQQLQLTRTR